MTSPRVSGALAYLALRSLRNRFVRLAVRLKDPRYLLAFVAGLAYFGWIFSTMLRTDDAGREVSREVFALPPWAEGLAPLPLALFAMGWWAFGNYHTALSFTPAEVHFLFSAPASRRTLIRYKLVGKQLGVLFTTTLGTLYLFLMSAGRLGADDLLLRAVALWLLITTIQLHQIASSLVRTAAAAQGRAGLRHQWIPLAVFLIAAVAVLAALFPALAAARAAEDGPGALEAIARALDDPAARAVLLPFRWAMAPLFARDLASWLVALPAATALAAVHYAWVLRTDAAFEEGAAEAGRERAERRRALSQGRSNAYLLAKMGSLARPWFHLRPHGPPAVALFWKNVTLAARLFRMRSALLLVAVFVGSYFLMRALDEGHRQAATIVTVMALVMGAMFFAGGSIFIRNDLRTDLAKLDLLRTYPLPGREVVAAEVAAATLTLTVVQLLFLYVGLAFLLLADLGIEPWWAIAAGLGALLLVLPPVNALMLGVQNALALLFPAWTRIGVSRPGGVEQMGMFMLTVLATLLFLAVALLPPVVFGGGVALRLLGTMGGWAILPAAIGGWLVLWGEVAVLVVLLGDAYDDMDPADAGLLG